MEEGEDGELSSWRDDYMSVMTRAWVKREKIFRVHMFPFHPEEEAAVNVQDVRRREHSRWLTDKLTLANQANLSDLNLIQWRLAQAVSNVSTANQQLAPFFTLLAENEWK